jgi:hypothetical protein
LYPDLFWRRLSWVTLDLLVAGWIYVWVTVGQAIHREVLRLEALARGVRETGRTFNGWILSFQQGIPQNVPFLTDWLRQQTASLRTHTGDQLIALGNTGSTAIQRLALTLAIALAAIPIVLVLMNYLPSRVQVVARMRGIHVTVRRGVQEGLPDDSLEFLAARALYTQPYRRLLRYTKNPIADWREKRFHGLARAELERHGLALEHYF